MKLTKTNINKWITHLLKINNIKTRGYRVEWNVYTDKHCRWFELECVDRKDVVDFLYDNDKCEFRPHITNLHDDDIAMHTPLDTFKWDKELHLKCGSDIQSLFEDFLSQ